jgi:hypothetical protein
MPFVSEISSMPSVFAYEVTKTLESRDELGVSEFWGSEVWGSVLAWQKSATAENIGLRLVNVWNSLASEAQQSVLCISQASLLNAEIVCGSYTLLFS